MSSYLYGILVRYVVNNPVVAPCPAGIHIFLGKRDCVVSNIQQSKHTHVRNGYDSTYSKNK